MILGLLPHLTQLSQINLHGGINLRLLTAINRHPVTTVLLDAIPMYSSLPSQSGPSDLAKFVLEGALMDAEESTTLDPYLSRGMQVASISLTKCNDESFGTQRYNGLCELGLELSRNSSFTLSWLPEFSRTHPHLTKIIFTSELTYFTRNPAAPFVSGFLDEIYTQLTDTIHIQRYAVTRAGTGLASATEPLGEWHVSGMYLEMFEWSFGRILHLVHSWFPQISVLTIRNTRCRIVCLDESCSSSSLTFLS